MEVRTGVQDRIVEAGAETGHGEVLLTGVLSSTTQDHLLTVGWDPINLPAGHLTEAFSQLRRTQVTVCTRLFRKR